MNDDLKYEPYNVLSETPMKWRSFMYPALLGGVSYCVIVGLAYFAEFWVWLWK
jgi:hypothetical protein